ncbi:hypothetical protein KZ829_16125 [Actinoplanes hulinensis]|uniref:Uncharacterized protein n=1 Tax=Actinoplanes hulinensis TaxID=1144547 RepID=A0ABS7B2L0_9ACTN|nr:hypothetical protein [Actinoplanes hulinensis]MBW6435266.1 hypothetical protein [Actinoplanes hulinensis]
MKNAKRMLALAGMTLAAGAMLGIAPAQAAPGADQSPSSKTVTSGWGVDWNVGWDDDYVVGVYNNPWACRNAGAWVSRAGAWGNFDCVPAWDVRWGRIWVLQVQRDYWSWNRWNGWQGNWPYRPNYLYGNTYNIGVGGYDNPFRNRVGFRYGHGVNGLGWGAGLNGFRYGNGLGYGNGVGYGYDVDVDVDVDRVGPWYKAGKIDKSVKSDKVYKSNKYDKQDKAYKAHKAHDKHMSPLGALNLKDQHKIK